VAVPNFNTPAPQKPSYSIMIWVSSLDQNKLDLGGPFFSLEAVIDLDLACDHDESW
jgi:hypothetical protein